MSYRGKEQKVKAASPFQSSMTIGGTKVGKPLKILSKFEEKTKFICKFCGGPPCPHEDWTRIKRPAIKGLNSNWINDDIVASQRLGEKLIKQHDIIGQFKSLGIGAVINLQEPGEHPYCGEPVVPEWGFSYSSEGLNNRKQSSKQTASRPSICTGKTSSRSSSRTCSRACGSSTQRCSSARRSSSTATRAEAGLA